MSRFRLKRGRNLRFSHQQKNRLPYVYTHFVILSHPYVVILSHPYVVILSHPYIVILSVSEGSAKVRETNEKTQILR